MFCILYIEGSILKFGRHLFEAQATYCDEVLRLCGGILETMAVSTARQSDGRQCRHTPLCIIALQISGHRDAQICPENNSEG